MKKLLLVISTCLFVLLAGCNDGADSKTTDTETATPNATEKVEVAPNVMINGKLYQSTGIPSQVEKHTVDGTIKSSVDSSEFPTENDQSNFGDGYDYDIVDENTVEININGNWNVYKLNETSGN